MTTRVTISLPIGLGLSPSQQVTLARRADAAGLSSVAVGELVSTEAMSLLGAIAAATERIRLETSVGAVVTRSPALYAMAAATLHDLSDGRFTLGIGAGSPMVAGFHGSSFDKPLARVRWSVTAIRQALAGGALPEAGGFKLRGVEPVDVPILVAAMNDAMARLAGSIADGVVLNFASPAEAARLGDVARHAVSSTRDRPFEVHTILWIYAGDDVAAARERFAREMAPYLAVPTYRRAAVSLAGERAIRRAEQALASGGRKAGAAAFPDQIIDAILVHGSPAVVAARVAEMGAAGCAGVRFTPLADDPEDFEAHCRAVDLLGQAVGHIGT